jgi:hypothetical protein
MWVKWNVMISVLAPEAFNRFQCIMLISLALERGDYLNKNWFLRSYSVSNFPVFGTFGSLGIKALSKCLKTNYFNCVTIFWGRHWGARFLLIFLFYLSSTSIIVLLDLLSFRIRGQRFYVVLIFLLSWGL